MKNLFVIMASVLLVYAAYGQSSWTSLNGPWYANDPIDMAVANNGTMYLIGGANHELVKSTNQGDTWTHLGQTNVYCVGVKPDNASCVYIGVDNGGGDFKVMRSLDGGTSWTTVINSTNGMVARPNRIAFSTASTNNALVGDMEYASYTAVQFQVFAVTNADAAGGPTITGSDYFKKNATITDIRIDPANTNYAYMTTYTVNGNTTHRGVWRSSNAFGSSSWIARNTSLVNKNIASVAIDPNTAGSLTTTRLYCSTYENVGTDVFTIYISTNSGGSWSPLSNNSLE